MITMVRTQIQLTERQATRLKEMAERRDVSMAQLVRTAVDRLLESEAAVDMEERWRRALEVMGRFDSGCTDVATEHDRDLADAFEE